MIEKLKTLFNKKVQVYTKGYHLGYAIYKGVLKIVDEEYIEIDTGSKMVIITIEQISTITFR